MRFARRQFAKLLADQPVDQLPQQAAACGDERGNKLQGFQQTLCQNNEKGRAKNTWQGWAAVAHPVSPQCQLWPQPASHGCPNSC